MDISFPSREKTNLVNQNTISNENIDQSNFKSVDKSLENSLLIPDHIHEGQSIPLQISVPPLNENIKKSNIFTMNEENTNGQGLTESQSSPSPGKKRTAREADLLSPVAEDRLTIMRKRRESLQAQKELERKKKRRGRAFRRSSR